MTFAKLDSGITKSSLWSEALHVRIVFLSFLAEKDESGFVSGSRPGMIRVCNVTPEQFDDAIKILSSPDPDSKSDEFEGKRILKCEGGWIVLNSDKYRLPEDQKKENRKEYMKNYMSEYRKNDVNVNKSLHEFTPVNNEFTSVSVSDSVSVSEENRNKIIPPKIEWVTEYCNERKNNVIPQKWYDFYQSKNWMIGKNKMKDWQAAVRTWEQNNNTTQNQDPPKKKNTDFKFISPYDMEK